VKKLGVMSVAKFGSIIGMILGIILGLKNAISIVPAASVAGGGDGGNLTSRQKEFGKYYLIIQFGTSIPNRTPFPAGRFHR
jgi:hypothetical protein